MLAKVIHDTFHANLLQPYKADKYGREKHPQPAIRLEDGSSEHEVDQILDIKKKKGKTLYLVKWVGFPDRENTMEAVKYLKNSQENIRSFKAARRRLS